MNIEAALSAHLSAALGLEVVPAQVPDNEPLPVISYQRISTSPTKHRSSQRANFGRVRFQIDGWSNRFDEAMTLRAGILAAMANFVRASDPRVDAALLQDSRTIREAEPERWRASLDYFIFTED